MNKNNQTLYIVLIIIVNLVLWPFIILPNAFKIAGSLLKNKENISTAVVIENSAATKEVLERIDFYSLRDPFLPGLKTVKSTREEPKKTDKPLVVKEKPVENTPAPEEKYESRFKLKSIVLLKDKYAAALEETPHYGNQTDNSPYSYRFGENYEQTQPGPKSYLVLEGDSVLGEQVVKITADSVLLRKGKKLFKLTFTGGSPVE